MPQFYLRHWCSADGKMWVHPKDGKPAFRAKPASFALEKGLYDSSDHNELSDFDFEANLSRIESHFSSVWEDVFHRAGANRRTKANLAHFLALLYLRHPERKSQYRDMNRLWSDTMEKIAPGQTHIEVKHSEGEGMISIEEIRQHMEAGERAIHESFLKLMRTVLRDISSVLVARKWGILQFNSPVVYTSDNPICLLRGASKKRAYGLGTPGTQILFPITPTKLLVMDDGFAVDGLTYAGNGDDPQNEHVINSASRFYFRL